MNFSPSVRFGNGGAIGSIASPWPMSQTQGIVAGAETEVMTKAQEERAAAAQSTRKISPLVIVLGLVALYAIFS